MKKRIVFLIMVIGFLGISLAQNSPTQIDNVTATIDKDTTDEQFHDLKKYFSEQGLTLSVENIKRNSQNEINALKLELSKGGQQTSYSSSSNTPINKLELGYKEGDVFIKTDSGMQMALGNVLGNSLGNSFSSFFNGNTLNNSTIDSLLQQNKFSFSFNSDDIRSLLNQSEMDFDELQKQFFSQFMGGPNNSSRVIKGKTVNPQKTLPKFSFINRSDIEKLIIIDGKESNFETLDRLAKADQLKEVDNLKSSTAISIYGNKARDGAIIATTK